MGGTPLNPTKTHLFAYVFIVFYGQKSEKIQIVQIFGPPKPMEKIQVFMPLNIWDVYNP